MDEVRKLDYSAPEAALKVLQAVLDTQKPVPDTQALAQALSRVAASNQSVVVDAATSAINELAKAMQAVQMQKRFTASDAVNEMVKTLYGIQEDQLISVEEVDATVEDVKPYLSAEASASLDEKLEKAREKGAKIPWAKIKDAILFVVTIWSLLLQLVPDPQTEIQTELLELQKQEAESSEDFRQRTEEHFKIIEDTQERIAQAIEMLVDQFIEADEDSQSVVDLADAQAVSDDCDALQNQPNAEN